MTAKRSAVLLNTVLDAVLPPRCVVTGDMVEQQGMVSSEAWHDLNFIADPFCQCCGFPFEYEVDAGSLCTSCLDHRPPFESHRSALTYNEASRSLILGFKHADKTHAVQVFVPWLRRAGSEILQDADYLLPVPLHYWRLVSRRYNQSALIAQALGKEAEIPALLDVLKRVRATPSQGTLTAKERFKNVKRAFAVDDKKAALIKGKTIVLIDDVYTTGATLKECTKSLLKAGAKNVHALTLARVVRDEFRFTQETI